MSKLKAMGFIVLFGCFLFGAILYKLSWLTATSPVHCFVVPSGNCRIMFSSGASEMLDSPTNFARNVADVMAWIPYGIYIGLLLLWVANKREK